MTYRAYTQEQIVEAVKTSISVADVCRKIGIKPVGGNFSTVNRNISRMNLDTSHFTGSSTQHFKQVDTLRDTTHLKKYLIRKFGHICWSCKNTEWMGKSIPLELEHKDGNSTNQSITNLEILCCNCHAQTPTWRRRKS